MLHRTDIFEQAAGPIAGAPTSIIEYSRVVTHFAWQTCAVIDVIGYLASLGALLMWLPQGWRVIRRRLDPDALEGISVSAYATGMLFNVLLLVYGIGTGGTPVIVAASVNLVMSSLIAAVVSKSRAQS